MKGKKKEGESLQGELNESETVFVPLAFMKLPEEQVLLVCHLANQVDKTIMQLISRILGIGWQLAVFTIGQAGSDHP